MTRWSTAVTVTRTLFMRRVIEARRYWLETIAVAVVGYIIFLLIFLGANTFGGSSVGGSDQLAAIVVGYSLWVLIQQGYQHFADSISYDTTTGTLEQLALSPMGLTWISVLDFLIQLLIETVRLALLLVAMMATTRRWLHIDVAAFFAIGLPTIGAVAGIGLALAALGLVYKRVSGIISLVGILFIAVLLVPPDRYPIVRAFPVALANETLRDVMVNGRGIADVSASRLGVLCAMGVGVFGLGALAFRAMEQKARVRGTLGQF